MYIGAMVTMYVGGVILGYYLGHVKGYRDGLSDVVKLRHEEIEEKYEEETKRLTIEQLRRARRNLFK